MAYDRSHIRDFVRKYAHNVWVSAWAPEHDRACPYFHQEYRVDPRVGICQIVARHKGHTGKMREDEPRMEVTVSDVFPLIRIGFNDVLLSPDFDGDSPTLPKDHVKRADAREVGRDACARTDRVPLGWGFEKRPDQAERGAAMSDRGIADCLSGDDVSEWEIACRPCDPIGSRFRISSSPGRKFLAQDVSNLARQQL
jgi:hypothetical protein